MKRHAWMVLALGLGLMTPGCILTSGQIQINFDLPSFTANSVTGIDGTTIDLNTEKEYQDNKDKLTGLQLDGVAASLDNMVNGTYKLSADGHMYTKGAATGLTKAFIDYILSPDVQNGLVKQLNYAPVM